MKPPVHSLAAIKAIIAPNVSDYSLRFVEFHRPYAIACMAVHEARIAYDIKFPKNSKSQFAGW